MIVLTGDRGHPLAQKALASPSVIKHAGPWEALQFWANLPGTAVNAIMWGTPHEHWHLLLQERYDHEYHDLALTDEHYATFAQACSISLVGQHAVIDFGYPSDQKWLQNHTVRLHDSFILKYRNSLSVMGMPINPAALRFLEGL